ncbi:cytochrome P450 [Seiridium cupressi]
MSYSDAIVITQVPPIWAPVQRMLVEMRWPAMASLIMTRPRQPEWWQVLLYLVYSSVTLSSVPVPRRYTPRYDRPVIVTLNMGGPGARDPLCCWRQPSLILDHVWPASHSSILPAKIDDKPSDPAEHSKRRRLMGQLFNRSQMHKLEGLMVHHIGTFIQAITVSKNEVNLMPACRALEADIISDFSFGHAIGAVAAYSQGEELAMVAKNDEKTTWMPMLTSFPGLCDSWERLEKHVFSVTGFKTSYAKAMEQFHAWAETSWSATLSANAGQEKPPGAFPNLVQTMVNSGLPPLTALSEATENLGPGTDTTSASLAHILWALAHNPGFQEELFQDLSHVSFSTDMTTLESVPKLQACVKEGIRWTGAAAAMLPRIVPEGGAEFHGHFIPEGIVRNFRIYVHPSLQRRPYLAQERLSTPAPFQRVALPSRREWVAAVPSERLVVALEPRS